MGTAGQQTRERLIETAERLFATEGVNGVSLREIVRASGARNVTALQYHFGDRRGLLRAVLERHHREIEAARHALLDVYEAGEQEGVHALSAALVRPLAAKLAHPGGRAYLRILGELVNRPEPVIGRASVSDPADSTYRWRALTAPMLEEDATRLHRRFVAVRFTMVELARRAQAGPHADDRLFISHLIDLVTAILLAPLSPQTLHLAGERDRERQA
ncbi:MAG: TetR/AcrR family transcriptional regulator [Actinoallomurus sp.]